MSKLMGMIAAMMSQAAADVPQAPPIDMRVERAGAGLRITVVGKADRDLAASFNLVVDSDVEGGGNHSSHAGTVSLMRGESAVLSVVNLGAVVPGRWRAELGVTMADGASYRLVRNAL